MKQYYYQVSGCKGENYKDPKCICWHDEGTGPIAHARFGSTNLEWREKHTTEIESLRQSTEALRAENEELKKYGRVQDPLLGQLVAEQLKSKALREALEHIEEYWNGDANDQAMFDALCHIEDTATKALNDTPASTASPQEAREHLEDYVRSRLGEPVAYVGENTLNALVSSPVAEIATISNFNICHGGVPLYRLREAK